MVREVAKQFVECHKKRTGAGGYHLIGGGSNSLHRYCPLFCPNGTIYLSSEDSGDKPMKIAFVVGFRKFTKPAKRAIYLTSDKAGGYQLNSDMDI